MKKGIGGLLFVSMLVLAGCVPSLEPLYDGKVLVFPQELVGTWKAKDGGKRRLTFTAASERSYTLKVGDNGGEPAELLAHVVNLSGKLYLDVVVEAFPNSTEIHDLTLFSLIPGHAILRVNLTQDSFSMAPMDADKFKKMH